MLIITGICIILIFASMFAFFVLEYADHGRRDGWGFILFVFMMVGCLLGVFVGFMVIDGEPTEAIRDQCAHIEASCEQIVSH